MVVDLLDVVDSVYKHSDRLKCDLRIANVLVVLGWESTLDSENLYTRLWDSLSPAWLRNDALPGCIALAKCLQVHVA